MSKAQHIQAKADALGVYCMVTFNGATKAYRIRSLDDASACVEIKSYSEAIEFVEGLAE